MITLGPRAVAAVVVVSHLLRSAWVRPASDLEQIESDILAFRQELARGQRLLSASNSALEVCNRETEVQRFLLKVTGTIELIFVGFFILFFWSRRRQFSGENFGETLALEEESEPETETKTDITTQVPVADPERQRSRGPTTPSALKRGSLQTGR